MDKERLSRRGIRPVYENGWDVCYNAMWDGWKLENVEFFWIFFASVGPLPAGNMYNF